MSDLPRAAAIYARISLDREGDQLGVTRQREDCLQLCIKKSWPVSAVYTDDDISAYSGKKRPAYRKLLLDIAEGAIDAVVVWHLDRLHRHPRELEEFFEVCAKAGVKHLASVTGDVDLSTHDGQFMARILGAVSKKESDDKSRRISRKHLELAQQGKPSGGGNRPYGYEKDWITVRESEANVLREAADRFLADEPVRSIARSFISRGILSASGRPWNSSRLLTILRSHRVAGLRGFKGERLGTAVWPAIISLEKWEQIRAISSDPARKVWRPAREYMLSGFLRCGYCDTKLVSAPRKDEGHGFRCIKGPGLKGCGKLRMASRYLDEFIAEAIFKRVDTPLFAKALAVDDAKESGTSELMSSIAADERALDQLAVRWANRDITEREWLIARDAVQNRLSSSRSRLKAIDRNPLVHTVAGKGGELRGRWPDLGLHERRAILAAVLEAIYVEPSRVGMNHFDPSRLRPLWRI